MSLPDVQEPGPVAHACCAPARTPVASQSASRPVEQPQRPAGKRLSGLVNVPGGRFLMGTDDGEGFPADGEGPVREVAVEPFRLAPAAVTVSQFATFAKATGYVTEAETIVLIDIFWRRRHAAPSQIIRRRADNELDVVELAGNQVRVFQRSNAKRDIDPFLGKTDRTIDQHQIDRNLRLFGEKDG